MSAVWPSERVLTRHLSLLISSFGAGKAEKDEAARQEAVRYAQKNKTETQHCSPLCLVWGRRLWDTKIDTHVVVDTSSYPCVIKHMSL